jgi:pimeloyl-ACP methyl ester carboxylesterase
MSLAFNLAHPEMTRALVLCDTGPGYKNPASREKWNETVFRRAERFEELGLDALNRSPEVEQVRQTQRSAAGLAKAARGMLAQFDSRVIDSLESIAVPTLVIVGENDTPFLAGTDYMASKIPHARKVVIADAGHSSNIDQPQAFNAAVLEFLDEVAARP